MICTPTELEARTGFKVGPHRITVETVMLSLSCYDQFIQAAGDAFFSNTCLVLSQSKFRLQLFTLLDCLRAAA
jgi:hypothetical protein